MWEEKCPGYLLYGEEECKLPSSGYYGYVY
jgi:hypothetical protein